MVSEVPFVRYRADYCVFAAEMAALARLENQKDLAESQVPSEVRWR
jgi:hypothetical protein